jgi:hypothetical protein
MNAAPQDSRSKVSPIQVPPKARAKAEYPLPPRLNSGAAVHPRMKDAECCAGATLIGEAAAQADP